MVVVEEKDRWDREERWGWMMGDEICNPRSDVFVTPGPDCMTVRATFSGIPQGPILSTLSPRLVSHSLTGVHGHGESVPKSGHRRPSPSPVHSHLGPWGLPIDNAQLERRVAVC